MKLKEHREKATPAAVVALARAECANYDHGGCVFGRACIGAGEPCGWFEEAVLPTRPDLADAYERLTAQARLAS